jgi:hypothetical protein
MIHGTVVCLLLSTTYLLDPSHVEFAPHVQCAQLSNR